MEKTPKKWSLSSILFGKNKKDVHRQDFSSDEDDQKAGFGVEYNKNIQTKPKTNKQTVQSFDQRQYFSASPEFHYFKSLPQQSLYRKPQTTSNQSNLDVVKNQLNLEKNRIAPTQYIYSSNIAYQPYQGSSQDEKSSYKSLSSPINKNDSETSSRTSLNKRTRNARNARYLQRIMREDGRPVTVYGSVNSMDSQSYLPTQNRLSASIKSSSLCSSEFTLHSRQSGLPSVRYRDPFEDKDDYENIHEVEALPPPVPPRSQQSRLSSINNTSVSHQPYYFDHALQKYVIFNTNRRIYSDDELCRNDMEQRPKVSNTSSKHQDILNPRSRKPLNINSLENAFVFSSERVVDNPQSKRSKSAIDFEKLMNEPARNKSASRARNLTNVDAIRYQPIQLHPHSDELQALRKTYSASENLNKNKASSISIPQTARKSLNALGFKAKNINVSSNLDNAINELELMYDSLMKDDCVIKPAEPRNIPSPTKFSTMMRKYEEYENEENKNDKEPDIVLDDAFSRNLKYANQMLKTSEPLPFGIPLGPIPPKPSQDYLSVEPNQVKRQNNLNLIADDLAVRNLRKDNPSNGRRRNFFEIDNNVFIKRNHTLSSLSDHIYNGILRDSTKPSGGNLQDYKQIDSFTLDKPKNQRTTDFEESLNALVVESKAISEKLEKDLSRLKCKSVTPNPPKTKANILEFRKSAEKDKQNKSVSCSPIKYLQSSAITGERENSNTKESNKDLEIVNPSKQQKAPKISNLIKMFNTEAFEPVKSIVSKAVIETKPKNNSDNSRLFETSSEIETKPPAQPSNGIRMTVSNDEKLRSSSKIISPKKVSLTMMNARIVSPKCLTSKVEEHKSQNNVESSINNIKELIEQIKLTEFDSSSEEVKPAVLNPVHCKLPDYDNIKDDYEMTDGRLKRISKLVISEPSLQTTASTEHLPEHKSNTAISPLLETSTGGSAKSEHFDESAAIYKDAIEFLHETAQAKTPPVEKEHKSPIETQTGNHVVLNYIDKTNNIVSYIDNDSNQKPNYNVKESISKLELTILMSRQDSETSEVSLLTHKPSTLPTHVNPVVLPQIDLSEAESLYNSAEELSMIFGNGEQTLAKVAAQDKFVPGKFLCQNLHVEDKMLDDNVNVTLVDNNTDRLCSDCFENSIENPVLLKNVDVSSTTKLEKFETKTTSSNVTSSKLSTLESESFNQQSAMKVQCILLACFYCVILYLQFIIFNFKSS